MDEGGAIAPATNYEGRLRYLQDQVAGGYASWDAGRLAVPGERQDKPPNAKDGHQP